MTPWFPFCEYSLVSLCGIRHLADIDTEKTEALSSHPVNQDRYTTPTTILWTESLVQQVQLLNHTLPKQINPSCQCQISTLINGFLQAWDIVRVILCFLFCCWERKTLEQWLAWAVLHNGIWSPAVSTSKAVSLPPGVVFPLPSGTSGNVWRCVCYHSSRILPTSTVYSSEMLLTIVHVQNDPDNKKLCCKLSILPTLRNYALKLEGHYLSMGLRKRNKF